MSSISAGTTSTTTLVHSGDTTGSLVFKTNDTGSGGTTAVTIDTSQNVGIGTTSPTQKLEVATASGGTICLRYIGNSGNVTLGTDANNNMLFSIGNPPTEKMRIDSSGNLLVGTTSNLGGSARLNVNYAYTNNGATWKSDSTAVHNAISFNNPNGEVGTIRTSGSATSYNTSSDYRLKDNIAPMTGALDVVSQLKPVTYKWKVDGSDGQGFMAHELQAIVPECVTGEKDAVDADGNPVYQGIDTSFLVATLTAALQETKALIDQQAETINALTARVVALEGQ